MLFFVLKIIISASLIAFCAWLSGRRPDLAGFIVALPLTTLLTLAFSYGEFRDTRASVEFAKSIFVAVPLTLVFFVPFLLAEKLRWGFWTMYASGFGLLAAAYFAHQQILGWMGK